MNIIKFDKKYANEVVEFIKDIAINEYGCFDWEDYFKRMDFKEYEEDDDDNIFYIALNDENEIIGTIGGIKKDNSIYMNSLYIRKDYRKLGIATKLYNLLINFSKIKKCNEITLRVFFNFIDAIKFYEKNGFVKYNQDEESYYYKKILE